MLLIRILLTAQLYLHLYFATIFDKNCFDMSCMVCKIIFTDALKEKKYFALFIVILKILYLYLISFPDEYAKFRCKSFWNETK
jgi:hypothetical protein